MSRKLDHFLKALPSCAGYDQTSFLEELKSYFPKAFESMVGEGNISDDGEVIAQLSQSATGIGLETGSDKTMPMQIISYHEYNAKLGAKHSPARS